MCLLFINNFNDNPNSDYTMIIASIRDESFDRPTKSVHRWPSNSNIVGGVDQVAGGSWFAVNVMTNKIAATLNVIRPLDEYSECSGKSRGFLVSSFLNSSQRGFDFCESVFNSQKMDYSPFNLITIDLNFNYPNEITYLSNFCDKIFTSNSPNVYCFGNDTPSAPFRKTLIARQMFSAITNSKLHRMQHKEQLIAQLFDLMNFEQKFLPDKNLVDCARGYDGDFLAELSSIHVKVPDANFGSRTQTVLLISKNYGCEWIERNFTVEHLNGNDNCDGLPLTRFNFEFDQERVPHRARL